MLSSHFRVRGATSDGAQSNSRLSRCISANVSISKPVRVRTTVRPMDMSRDSVASQVTLQLQGMARTPGGQGLALAGRNRFDFPDRNTLSTWGLGHLVEVTVVQPPVPGNTDQGWAHHALDSVRVELFVSSSDTTAAVRCAGGSRKIGESACW